MLKTPFVKSDGVFFMAEPELVFACNLILLDQSFLNKMFIFPFFKFKK